MLTSTVPKIIDGLIDGISQHGVTAFEAWPGPDAAPEMLVLGEVTWETYEIPVIKAGRKPRQERYDVNFELFVMGRPGSSPARPRAARERAFLLLSQVENFLADDVTATTDHTVVNWVQVRLTSAQPRVFENGWAYRVAGVFTADARLL